VDLEGMPAGALRTAHEATNGGGGNGHDAETFW
jgi:hypothetical protein